MGRRARSLAFVSIIAPVLIAGVDPYARLSLYQNTKVLDGDTILFNGEPLKFAGIDAPELGPWARCWSEAALAGHAKEFVETELSKGDWRIIVKSEDGPSGRKSVQVSRRSDDEDLGNLLVVYGYAAATSGLWDWCGENALHQPQEDEPQPHGPNLWWPTGAVFDARALD